MPPVVRLRTIESARLPVDKGLVEIYKELTAGGALDVAIARHRNRRKDGPHAR